MKHAAKLESSVSQTARAFRLLCACGLAFIAAPAEAFEVSGGVGVGGVLLGSRPRLAVTPNVGITWRIEGGLHLAIHQMFSILMAANEHGVGVYDRTSLMLGYATENANFNAGPSLSLYSIPACNIASFCSRVVGLSPGGQVQANVYFTGRLGLSVSAGVDWIGGKSLVLPGGVAVTVVAGPVLRWAPRRGL